MNGLIIIITIICFIPPVIAVFDIIKKLNEQKYMDDAQDLFFKEIVRSVDEQKKKNASEKENALKSENKEMTPDISENNQETEPAAVKEEPERSEDTADKEKAGKSEIEKEAALEIVMNMLKTNRDNKKETTSQDLDSMISILSEAKKKK